MKGPAGLVASALAAMALGCTSIAGLNDLKKVECADCDGGAEGGAGGPIVRTAVAGWDSSCAILDEDGSFWCWGNNPGAAPGTPSSTPVFTGLTDVIRFSIGEGHTCALDESRTVWCWGRNDRGQLGNGTTTASPVPVRVPALPAIDTITAAKDHTCAYTTPEDRPVQTFCWGSNSHGQLGDGTTNDSPSPVPLVFDDNGDIFRLGGGDSYSCGIVNVPELAEVRCWGRNDRGQCGIDPSVMPVVMRPTAVPGVGPMERVYPSVNHLCTRTQTTRLPWCWGANEDGQTGNNAPGPFALPAQVVGSAAITTMTPGLRHGCLSVRGESTILCWGANDLGQFDGNPVGIDVGIPAEVDFLSELDGFIMRMAEHGCGTRDGQAWCWGANDSGQIGNGTTGTFSAPHQVVFR